MDYCRKAHCLLPCGKLDGLCIQGHYANEPLPFQWPSRTWLRLGLTLVRTYVSRSRWWHGTASRSFAPLRTPFAIGTPWQSAWCGDPGQPLSPIRLAWSLPDKCLWNAKMKLIVRSSSRKCPIPLLLPYSPWLYLQECPSGCKLHRLLPQVWGPTASPQGSGLPRRSLPFAIWRPSKRLPCLLLSSSSPDTSPLGSTAWFLQLDGPFRTTKENWMRDISATTEDSNLTFGMHWGMPRQCPLVMAYRGRTDRDWIIEVTMCCPERTK